MSHTVGTTYVQPALHAFLFSINFLFTSCGTFFTQVCELELWCQESEEH